MNMNEFSRSQEGIARRLPQGLIHIVVPKLDSVGDKDIRDFLANETENLAGVFGRGPILYSCEQDVMTRCLRNMHKSVLVTPPRDLSSCTAVARSDRYAHTVYLLRYGAALYIGPDEFSMQINDVFVPFLAIRDSGDVEEMATTARSFEMHKWKGLAQDKVLFESLKYVARQDPALPTVRIETSTGPIIFYKPAHRIGQHVQQYLDRNTKQLTA